MRIVITAFFTVLAVSCSAQSYRLSGSLPLKGDDAWDYLRADSASRRLYISHGTTVHVLNLDTHKLISNMTGFGFIHGIVILPSNQQGFLSDGQHNEILTFDPGTLAITGHIKTADNPNSMVYNEPFGRLFIGHKPSQSMSVLNTATKTIESVIPLNGIPEFPVTDGKSIFVNIENKNEIVRIDAGSLEITGHFSVFPCKQPGGLAIDAAEHLLFAACDNKLMAVVDSETGKLRQTVPIGSKPDAAAYDRGTGQAFSSNGDGTLSVIHRKGTGPFRLVQTLKTAIGARTMTLDERDNTLFLSVAKLGPAPAPTLEVPNPPKHPTALPGSFRVLVVTPIAGH